MGLKERGGDGGAERLVALAGNPNVGKSTLFNALTGLRQHTGNWPGKTVELAQGTFTYKAETYRLVDLPGTYSLQNCSKEEKVTTDFLEQEAVSCTLAVCDATNLERSLLLVLEVLETADRVMVCVNLMDEAERSGISLDLHRLEAELGVPVVGVAAAQKKGLEALRERLRSICDGFERPHPRRLGLRRAENQRQAEENIRRLAGYAAELAGKCMRSPGRQGRTEKIDRFVTGKVSGPILFCVLLFAVLWLTVSGANVFSDVLESAFASGIDWLHKVWSEADWTEWLGGLLLDGILGTTTKVTAVMLPPVMIFFPLFTLLEDVGYLPRVAYLLDAPLAHCGGCGRQALTMCMGKNRMPKLE